MSLAEVAAAEPVATPHLQAALRSGVANAGAVSSLVYSGAASVPQPPRATSSALNNAGRAPQMHGSATGVGGNSILGGSTSSANARGPSSQHQSNKVIYTWGLGLSGRLGHGDEADRAVPMPVANLGDGVVECGGHHSAFVTAQLGQIYTWGGGAFGKLGHGDKESCLQPALVQSFTCNYSNSTSDVGRGHMIQCVLGSQHSMCLSNRGEVFTWGQAGRLGHALSEMDEVLPRQVMALAQVFAVQVSCGHSHCAVVSDRGDVWAWGTSRAYGHTDTKIPPNVPTQVRVLTGKAVVAVSCGISHTVALSDQNLFADKLMFRNAQKEAAQREQQQYLSGEDVESGRMNRPNPNFLRGGRGQSLPSSAATRKAGSSALGPQQHTSGLYPPGAGLLDHGGYTGDVDGVSPAAGGLSSTTGVSRWPSTRLQKSSSQTQRDQLLADRDNRYSRDRSAKELSGTKAGDSEGGVGKMKGEVDLTQHVFLSDELKSYQNLALRLTKQLQDAYSKIFDLQSENSFLKSELEVMHHNSRQPT
ncbi:unnamed protein product [Amoebophrya sp. A25]|nr:unnamed protein product [Amoebophrya sp. A25]|eukprot:GSA25T00005782001.1